MEKIKKFISTILVGSIGLAGLVSCSKEDKKVWINEKTGSSTYPLNIIVDSNKDGTPDRTETYMILPGHVGGYMTWRNPTTQEIEWYKTKKQI